MQVMIKKEIECIICLSKFLGYSQSKYCSDTCREKAWKKQTEKWKLEHPEIVKKYAKEHYLHLKNNPKLLQETRERARKWHQEHKEMRNKRQKERMRRLWNDPVWAEKERKRCREDYHRHSVQRRLYTKELRKKYKTVWNERERKKAKIYRLKNRERLFETYGDSCGCCGEKNKKFLTLDHVNGGGKNEISEKGHTRMIREATRNPDFSKYQILCYNCNMGRAKNHGICPHKESTSPQSTSQ